MYTALFHKMQMSHARLLIIKLADLISSIKYPSDNERESLLEKRSATYYHNPKRWRELLQYYNDQNYSKKEMLQLVTNHFSPRIIKRNGVMVLADTTSKFFNVVNGHRLVPDAPQTYDMKIYIRTLQCSWKSHRR